MQVGPLEVKKVTGSNNKQDALETSFEIAPKDINSLRKSLDCLVHSSEKL